ncbi:Short-chain dehydrogenase/reductase SDR [Penicillium expansum]|nr:Short-chain dehydrogenase/reductase SDR [Penicillium expansum]
MTPEHLQNHFGINVFGTLFMTQAVVTLGNMPRGGRIINIGSCASKMGVGDGMGVYGATKAATDYLSASWAWELGRSRGITINSIGPGPVDTDIIGDGVAHVTDPSIHKDLFITPFVNLTRAEERVGTTDDVADAVLLLVNEKSRWITGQFISVSGGINVM